MKKIILVLSVFAILLSGCRREIFPIADFGVNYTKVQPYEDVVFTDFSGNAHLYSWDFGDGSYSKVSNPTHYYEEEGTYMVTLTVESVDGNIDVATITIEVIYTLLEITVADYFDYPSIGFVVENAGVWVYDNLDDWLYDDGTNAIIDFPTDHYGTVTFAGLDARQYYIFVQKTVGEFPNDVIIYDNYDFYDYKGNSFITTPQLTMFALNKWTAWVDYLGKDKSSESPRIKRSGTINRKPRIHKNDLSKIKRDERSFIIVDVSK